MLHFRKGRKDDPKASEFEGVDTRNGAAGYSGRDLRGIDHFTTPIMAISGEDRTITYMNRAAQQALNEIRGNLPFDPENYVGKSIETLHPKLDIDVRAVMVGSSSEQRNQIRVDEIFFDYCVNPTKNAEGLISGAVMSFEDVTERIKAVRAETRIMNMIREMPINVMLCDPETLVITYTNETSKRTLKEIEHLLPVKTETIVGTCIDIFHKHPEHQRKLLADPNNLPYSAKIKLGDEHMKLDVSAVYDADGNYDSAMLTWSLITDRVLLEDKITALSEQLEVASNELGSRVDEVDEIATRTRDTSTQVLSEAESASGNVQSVAATVEELSNSISEIAQQVSKATDISGEAVSKSRDASENVTGLANASERVGEVVSLINDIAAQTHLLALNATIEAARAGEAGRGFAVVASEVKNLATQTARATEEISSQISSIQEATRTAVVSIDDIQKTIDGVNEISSAIAAAVEEQNAATGEISDRVREVAQGTSSVTEQVSQVVTMTNQTSDSAEKSAESIEMLRELSASLEQQLAEFAGRKQ